MRKWVLLMTIILSCISMTSCSNTGHEDDMIDSPPRDMTLAGSISGEYATYNVGYSYDGVLLEVPDDNRHLLLTIQKESDTEISIHFFSLDKRFITILIPVITVLGEPDNVTFDYLSDDAAFAIYKDIAYDDISVSFKGWMKGNHLEMNKTNTSVPDYSCDINIECDLDGKKLNFKMTNIR